MAWNSNKQEVKDKKDKFKGITWDKLKTSEKDKILKEIAIKMGYVGE